jgi:CRP-like cAMP-binding protein
LRDRDYDLMHRYVVPLRLRKSIGKAGVSQSDLAAMAGVARENVSRTLAAWRRRKIIHLSAGRYCIANAKALRREMDGT